MKSRLPYAILVSFIIIGLSVGFLLLKPKSSAESCSQSYRTDKMMSVNGHDLKVQVAKTETEREKGLGGKTCIAPDESMLFEFGAAGSYPFWMKDMRFSVDIIWLDADHDAVWTEEGISPSTYPHSFTNQSPARDVLELKAGQAKALGIHAGTHFNY